MNAKFLRLLAALLLTVAAYADETDNREADSWAPENNTYLTPPVAGYSAPESGAYVSSGPNTYGPNGEVWQRIDNVTFGPHSQVCQQVGSALICSGR